MLRDAPYKITEPTGQLYQLIFKVLNPKVHPIQTLKLVNGEFLFTGTDSPFCM